MYESYYGLTEKPFTLLPDPDYLYLSPKHLRALTLLEYGLMNQAGFSVICGDIGAGKTTLIRRLLTGLGDDTTVGLITNTHQSFGDLLSWILMSFGIDCENKNKAQMHQMFIAFLIEQYAKNLNTVLIVDEAQNMNADTLEELRMLSNINADKDQVLQVILAGQPALRNTLRKPELMQFAQRISVDYYLESLSREESFQYINHRLKIAGAEKEIFTEKACDAIYRYSGGTPRLINLLCDTAMVYGFAEQTDVIDEKLVEDVVKEQHSNSIVPTFNKPLSDFDIEKIERNKIHKQNADSLLTEKENIDDNKIEAITSEVGKLTSVSVSNIGSSAVMVDAFVGSGNKASESSEHKETESPIASNITSIGQNEAEKEGEVNTGLAEELLKTIKEEKELELEDAKNEANETHSDVEAISEHNDLKEEGILEAKEESENEANEAPSDVEAISEHDALKEEGISDTKEDLKESSYLEAEQESEKEKGNIEEQEEIKEEFEGVFIDRRQSGSSNGNEGRQAYPIVQIEDNNKKDIKLLILVFIIGLILASLLSLGGAYILFGGDRDNKIQQLETLPVVRDKSDQLSMKVKEDRIRLEALQKERDAALAITKALERERDAALAAAKAEESMRNAERRAGEIIAEQERRSAAALRKVTQRARKAELETIRWKENEHQAKLKAMKEILEEQKKIKRETDFTDPVPVIRKLQPVAPKKIQATESPVKKSTELIVKKVPDPVVKESEVIVKDAPKKKSKFSTNPCSSPSAKFLSTCKK